MIAAQAFSISIFTLFRRKGSRVQGVELVVNSQPLMATVGGRLCRPPLGLQVHCGRGISNEEALRTVNNPSFCRLRTSHESICSNVQVVSLYRARFSSRFSPSQFRYLTTDFRPCATSSRNKHSVQFKTRRSGLHACAALGERDGSRGFEREFPLQEGEIPQDEREWRQGAESASDGESGQSNEARGVSRVFQERGFQGGNEAYSRQQQRGERGNGRGPGVGATFARGSGTYADDGSGGRYNAPGARPGGFVRDRPVQFERTSQSGRQAQFDGGGMRDDISDDDGGVQTRSFEKGRPRVPQGGIPPGLPGGPPEEPGAPFRRARLKKELFEKQGKELARNLGLDERDLYGWKADDLRNADSLDEGKRPEFRDFSQRDIFRDRIRTAPEPRPPPQKQFPSENRPSETGSQTPWVRNGVSTAPPGMRPSSDSPFDTRPANPQFRNRVSAPPNPRQGGRGASGRVAPGDFQNQMVKPFQKAKLPGLDVGPTIDSIKPKFVPREERPDTNHLGWKPDNNRGYKSPRETRFNAAVESPPDYRPPQETNQNRGEDLPQGGPPQQWLRRPPPPLSRYRPVARDGEIQYEEDKGGKQRPSGLEQEDDGFWDEEHEGEEISFARAALSHE